MISVVEMMFNCCADDTKLDASYIGDFNLFNVK